MEAMNAILEESRRVAEMSWTARKIHEFSKNHEVKNGVLSEVWETLSDDVKIFIINLSEELDDFHRWQDALHEWHGRMP